jgi:hypothetical protein
MVCLMSSIEPDLALTLRITADCGPMFHRVWRRH